MSSYYDVIAISSEENGLLKEIADREQVAMIPIELSRKITPLKDLKSLWEMYKTFRKEAPFIVHTHTPKAGVIGMIASYMAKVPHRLHTVAGMPLMESKGLKRSVLNIVEKITYYCATQVYPNSYGLLKFIEENNFVSKNKIKVIANGSSNGIDTNHFSRNNFTNLELKSLRDKLQINDNDFIFIFVGRIVGDKGVNELIEAFNQLSQTNNDVKLLLVGPFEESLDPIKNETKEIINSNKSIINVGFQDDVRPFFAISNMLVFPSYREGFPNVVMQACAMEIPSIVSNINGCNEIIVDTINGKIIPVKDTESLLKAMTIFVENREILIQMSKNSREQMINKYERALVWKSLLSEYQALD